MFVIYYSASVFYKIQLSKFRDLLCFIKLFMNWAAPYLPIRKLLCGAAQNESFYKEEGGTKKLLTREKKG